MGQRHPNFPAWQWRHAPQQQRNASLGALQLIAMPLFILSFLLIVSGAFSPSLPSFAIGVVGLLAALGMQHRSHHPQA